MEVLVGQVNFRGSLPRSTSYVLEHMLHPAAQFLKNAIFFIYIKVSLALSQNFKVGLWMILPFIFLKAK